MKVEKGMYIKTDKGRIGKVISDEYEYRDDYNQDYKFNDEIETSWDMWSEAIVDAKYNILELLEEGDCINGMPILEITGRTKAIKFLYGTILLVDNVGIHTKDPAIEIEYVITKEQMREHAYKEGE